MNGKQTKKLRKEAIFLNDKPLNYLIHTKTNTINQIKGIPVNSNVVSIIQKEIK